MNYDDAIRMVYLATGRRKHTIRACGLSSSGAHILNLIRVC